MLKRSEKKTSDYRGARLLNEAAVIEAVVISHRVKQIRGAFTRKD